MLDNDLEQRRIDCIACGWSGLDGELIPVKVDAGRTEHECPRCGPATDIHYAKN